MKGSSDGPDGVVMVICGGCGGGWGIDRIDISALDLNDQPTLPAQEAQGRESHVHKQLVTS